MRSAEIQPASSDSRWTPSAPAHDHNNNDAPRAVRSLRPALAWMRAGSRFAACPWWATPWLLPRSPSSLTQLVTSPLSVVSPGQLSSLTQLVTSLLSVVSPGRLSSLTRLVFTPLLMFVFLFLHRDWGRGWVWYLGYWAVLRRLPGLGTCCGIPLSTRCAHLLAGITTWRSHTSRLHTLAHGQITLCSSMLGSCSVLVGVGRRCCGSAVRGAGCAGCGNLYTGLCCGTCPALLGAAVYLRVPTPPVLFATKNTPHGSLHIFPRCTTCSGC